MLSKDPPPVPPPSPGQLNLLKAWKRRCAALGPPSPPLATRPPSPVPQLIGGLRRDRGWLGGVELYGDDPPKFADELFQSTLKGPVLVIPHRILTGIFRNERRIIVGLDKIPIPRGAARCDSAAAVIELFELVANLGHRARTWWAAPPPADWAEILAETDQLSIEFDTEHLNSIELQNWPERPDIV